MIIEPLKDSYGDAVAVNYFDIHDEDLDQRLREFFATHNYPMPLTFLNGEAVSAGYISYYDVSARIDEMLKGEKNN